jgi:hypothetical protein
MPVHTEHDENLNPTTAQRVYLRHRLNPRRFGRMILFRVTDTMSKKDAYYWANRIKRTGRLVRVDTFQGKFAVWISAAKLKVSVPKGRLGIDDSATKYLTWLLPDYWYVIKGYKTEQYTETGYLVGMNVVTPRGSPIYLLLYEHSKYLEIYSVSAIVRGKGDGTILMSALKSYVDSKGKGMMLRLVKNWQFFDKFSWLKEYPSQVSPETEFPDYLYKVNPKTKRRYLWI